MTNLEHGMDSESHFLERPDCGVCTGNPNKSPCPENFETEHLDLPALEHPERLCIKALYHMLERVPTRMKRTKSMHSWHLVDTAVGISRNRLYQAEATSLLDLSFSIADNIRERPYEGAYEQIQSRTILAYQPMLEQLTLDRERGISDSAIIETRDKVGGVIETIEKRFHEYWENDEVGIADNHSAQLEIAYLGLRAGIHIWPASVRQEKSLVQRENYDLYVDYGTYMVPIQVINNEDKRKYDSRILKLNYPQFRRQIMEMNKLKERDYARTIRKMIVSEANGEVLSTPQARRLDRGGARLLKIIASHAEENL